MTPPAVTSAFLVVCGFVSLSVNAEVCRDRMASRTCRYFVTLYRTKDTDCCEWKSMKTNCALTCKTCERKPRCATSLSKYGCCWDQKTEAHSYGGEGCPECKDNFPRFCQQRVSRFSRRSACNERGKKMCPKSCGVCKIKAAAQARPDCLDTPYGCCWDLTAATGPNGAGCRVCRNLYHRLCSLWKDYCKPDAYRFVKENVVEKYRYSCPVTCGQCRHGETKLDISAFKRRL